MKRSSNAYTDAYMRIRKEWAICPVTRTIPNKKKDSGSRKAKHKNDFDAWL